MNTLAESCAWSSIFLTFLNFPHIDSHTGTRQQRTSNHWETSSLATMLKEPKVLRRLQPLLQRTLQYFSLAKFKRSSTLKCVCLSRLCLLVDQALLQRWEQACSMAINPALCSDMPPSIAPIGGSGVATASQSKCWYKTNTSHYHKSRISSLPRTSLCLHLSYYTVLYIGNT